MNTLTVIAFIALVIWCVAITAGYIWLDGQEKKDAKEKTHNGRGAIHSRAEGEAAEHARKEDSQRSSS
jgi:hypothetical protein